MTKLKNTDKFDSFMLFRNEIVYEARHLKSIDDLFKTIKHTKVHSSLPFGLTIKLNDYQNKNANYTFYITNKYGRINGKVYGFATVGEGVSLVILGGVDLSIILIGIGFILAILLVLFTSSPSLMAIMLLSLFCLLLIAIVIASGIWTRNKIIEAVIRRLEIYDDTV